MRTSGQAWSGAALALLLACRPDAFACDEASDCSDTPGGICQPEGYCSFPDDTCPSGQRFGEYSGSLSNMCVPVHESDTEVGTSTTPASTDPTTTGMSSTGSTSTGSEEDDTTPVVSEGSDTSSTSGGSETTGETAGSSSGGPAIDPDLALWFTFEDIASDDGIANDGLLGGAAACSDTTCPAQVRGPIEAAGAFDGVDDCAVFDGGDLLVADAAFTLTAWLRLTAVPDGPVVILGQPYGDGVANTWDLAVLGDGLGAWLVYEGILDAEASLVASIQSEPLQLDGWVHVAATHEADRIALWIDGELVAQAEGFALVSDQQPLMLGCDDDHAGMYDLFLAGALDDVRLYERPLEPDELADLAMP